MTESRGITTAFARIEALGARIRSLLPPLPGGGAPAPAATPPSASFPEALSAATDGVRGDVPADLAPRIRAAAEKHRIPVEILESMVRVESNFNPRALSPRNAAGLLQLMPETAREMGVSDRFSPDENLDGGARYLAEMRRRFRSLPLALAAYNAGPSNVERYGAIPPYAETRNYVDRILAETSVASRALFESAAE